MSGTTRRRSSAAGPALLGSYTGLACLAICLFVESLAAQPSQRNPVSPLAPGEIAEQLPPANTAPSAAVPALESEETTLESLERIAQRHHPQIVAAWNTVEAAEGDAIQARLYPNPTVGVSSPQLAGSESQYNAFVSQDVITGGKLRLDAAAACQQVERRRLELVRARFDVLTTLRRQFYSTLAAQNRVAVLEDVVAINFKSQKIGQDLRRVGEGARTDTLILEIELHRAELALENARTAWESGKRQLAAVAGVPDLRIDTLYGDLSAELPQFDPDQLPYEVVAVNAQRGIAETELQRSRVLLDRAVVEPHPTFNIMGGYQRQFVGVEHQGIFQVTMTVPLWDRNQGGIRSAQAAVGKAQAEARRVQVELTGQTAAALGRYRTALATVERYQRDILPKSRESLELTQQLFERGVSDLIRILQAQKTLSDVELGYIDAQESRWNAAAELANLLQVEQFP